MFRSGNTIRMLRRLVLGLIGLLILLSAVLRVQAYLYKRRAQQLMADFQALELRHSQWTDAQRLISRWGKFGSYEGDCTASFCRYRIVLESPETRLGTLGISKGDWSYDFILRTASVFSTLSEHLGGRSATIRASFVVQDGVVVRKSDAFMYDVPRWGSLDSGYSLIATSRATSRLSSDGWPLTHSEQLAEHPYYAVTRPGGCSFCLMANVTFTPDTPKPEMDRLTTFNLACLTNFKPCRNLEDIYPASEEWHLYDGAYGGRPLPANRVGYKEPLLPATCRVPLFARGREASEIYSVTSLEESQQRMPGEVIEKAKVRLESVMKGSTQHPIGELLNVVSQSHDYPSPEIETPLTPGKHFLLLSVHPEEKSQAVLLERCLVLPDTPEARVQLQQGIAQNNRIRSPDTNASLFIPD